MVLLFPRPSGALVIEPQHARCCCSCSWTLSHWHLIAYRSLPSITARAYQTPARPREFSPQPKRFSSPFQYLGRAAELWRCMRSKTNDPMSPKGQAIEAESRFAQVRAAHVWQFRTIEEIAARQKIKEEQDAGAGLSVDAMK